MAEMKKRKSPLYDAKPAEAPKVEGGEAPPAKPEKKAEPEKDTGGDHRKSMMERHAKERAAVHRSHEVERRDMHGSHREDHRRMAERHDKMLKELAAKHDAEMAEPPPEVAPPPAPEAGAAAAAPPAAGPAGAMAAAPPAGA